MSRHLPGLDGIRGLAILLVAISHFIIVGGDLDPLVPLHRLLLSGYLGVDLFFVLSGFLITGLLIDARGSKNYFVVFYLRRALRIFPLYYAVLLAAWLSVVLISPQDQARLTGEDSLWWHWLYLSNIGIALKGTWLETPTWVCLSHFWSLAIEEQFYLFWPLIVWLLPGKWLERTCMALAFTSPFVLAVLFHTLGGTAAYVSTPGRLGELAAGAWLAILFRKPAVWSRITPWFAPVAMITGALLFLERSFLPVLKPIEQTNMMVLAAACVGLAASGSGRFSSSFFQSSVLRWLGTYSYGIYVYHHALKNVWLHFLWKSWLLPALGPGWGAKLLYLLTAGSITLALAWLSWKCLESPILSLKNRVKYAPKPGAG